MIDTRLKPLTHREPWSKLRKTLPGFLESAVADQNMEEKFELVAGAREGVGVGRRAKGAMGSEKRLLKGNACALKWGHKLIYISKCNQQ